MLAAYEMESRAYRGRMSRSGLVPNEILERDLAPTAYIVAVAVPLLVAEIRKLRSDRSDG